MPRVLKQFGKSTSVGITSSTNPVSEALAALAVTGARTYGVTVAKNQPFPLTVTDFTPYVEAFKSAGDARPVTPDVRPALACYRVAVSAFRTRSGLMFGSWLNHPSLPSGNAIRSEKVMTCSKIAPRRSRPKPIPVREPT